MEVGIPNAEQTLHDRRIERITPLATPALLMHEHPLPAERVEQVVSHREQVTAILDREDPRLMVVVGPCSVHDPAAALDYAQRLAALAPELEDLLLVMRVYFEEAPDDDRLEGPDQRPNARRFRRRQHRHAHGP